MKEKKVEEKYSLRARSRKSIFESHNLPDDYMQVDDYLGDETFNRRTANGTRSRKKKSTIDRGSEDDYSSIDDEDLYDNDKIVDKLPEDKKLLETMLATVNSTIKQQKHNFFKEQEELKITKSYAGELSIPICADVTKFNFDQLIQKQLSITQRYFDVIMMDPPWKLSSSHPSRGVAIQYDSLNDECIEKIPVPKLQKNGGMLMIWTINAKYPLSIQLMEKWGYKMVDSISWVKKTVNNRIAKGHGYYLQHAKETCLIGVKGNLTGFKKGVKSDIIFSDRRGQSQKPTEIYEYIEELVPNGYYLEIFGRRNNLRDKWVTIGNQI